jgi:CheY-like chemotaxis protein
MVGRLATILAGVGSGMATLLIVDDEFAIADLLEMVLVDEGYQVLKAGNAPGFGHFGLYDADPRWCRPDAGDARERHAARHTLHRHELDA